MFSEEEESGVVEQWTDKFTSSTDGKNILINYNVNFNYFINYYYPLSILAIKIFTVLESNSQRVNSSNIN